MEHWLWIILAALFFGTIAGDKISPVEDEVSKREGESVTLRCDYEKNDNIVYLYWYRHHSDLQAPQFILWKGARDRSSREYIPDKRYESETSVNSTELTIKTLTLADTGLYYCALRTGVVSLVFGMPISLTITPNATHLDPNLFILNPLQPDGGNRTLGPQVCLATDFHPKEGEMVLNQKDGPVSINTSTAAMSLTRNGTYVFAGFTNRSIYSCEMHGTPHNNDNRELCADFHPEKARLNFYLLMMNGVRVVFTKTLAFNTILTIRALLF